jgi:CRISPR-associated protein Csb2
MIAIAIKPLAGRLHATPWGRHVNEAAAEWPPSPWRLLRCLIATWKVKALDIDDDSAERILRELSSSPDFLLPPATTGHTRHYMPWDKTNPGDTTLIFDPFIAVGPKHEVVVRWPDVDLDENDRSVIAQWLRHVGYFGRSESWCEMRLLPDEEATGIQPNCGQLREGETSSDTEIVRVLCPEPETAFSSNHTPRAGRGKKSSQLYDPDWHICAETLWLHQEKWADPPGSRWLRYERPADCFQVTPAPRRPTATIQAGPQIARFALDSTVLPLVTETLHVGDSARSAVMSRYGRIHDGAASEVFSGKRQDGSIRTDHGHAFYLPTDEDGDGRLDHLTVVASSGFSEGELKALVSLRILKVHGREQPKHPLRLVLTGLGKFDEFHPGPVEFSRTWISATPYLAHRHPRKKGSRRDSPEELASPAAFLAARLHEDIVRLRSRRPDLEDMDPSHVQIEPLMPNGVFRIGARKHRPLQFKRFRRKRGDDGGKRLSGAFRITFPNKIQGPVALGHSCHFGMGLFLPEH